MSKIWFESIPLFRLCVCVKENAFPCEFLLTYPNISFIVGTKGHGFRIILTLDCSNDVFLQQLVPFVGIRDKV